MTLSFSSLIPQARNRPRAVTGRIAKLRAPSKEVKSDAEHRHCWNLCKEDEIEESANYDEICASVTTFEDETQQLTIGSRPGLLGFKH